MALSAKTTSSTITTSTTSARTAYPAVHDGRWLWRVYNAGTGVAMIRSGNASVDATTSDQYIPAGGSIVIIRDINDTNLAAIVPTGTGAIYFAPAESNSSTVG